MWKLNKEEKHKAITGASQQLIQYFLLLYTI